MTANELSQALIHHLRYSLGKDPDHASLYDWRMALSLAVRDLIVEPWFESTRRAYVEQHKRVYYLSMEFLIGRLLEDAIVNLNLLDAAEDALLKHGVSLQAVVDDEPDAALGNGGLGRLAACFLDSLTTLGVPAMGYGIRYEHGLFRQHFDHGVQIESPEDWLQHGNAWEFERPEAAYTISFGGYVDRVDGVPIWRPSESVIASCYDTPVVGWKGRWANTLRLWSSRPTEILRLADFNRGDYAAAAQPEALARAISRVLYPDDTTPAGKELRLKQEYFFTAASLHDILRRFQSEYADLRLLPEKVAIQLNDTHPAIAGPELLRLLLDEHRIPFEEAMEIVVNTLSYTNHTLLPEALETWPRYMFSKVLPRHMRLIERIDDWHSRSFPDRPVHLAIIRNDQVHMGPLAFICAHRVNGVSALHTELVKQTVFADLHALHPDRIVNETNGVTPRRWLHTANRPLSALITSKIGDGWIDDLEQLWQLEQYVDDDAFLDAFREAKRSNKRDLLRWLKRDFDIDCNIDAMFDVQIKRIHEYKRQLLNILETIGLWHEMRENPHLDWTPRVKFFGGKAAPGYDTAKLIIRLINDVAATINADDAVRGRLQVVYPANYNVSMAERLIPAADLSEQISTAGKEASGTGNMKLTLNGALTIGTLDGANVEIGEQVGADNFFLFGLNAEEVVERRAKPGHAREAIEQCQILKDVLQLIAEGRFSPDQRDRYHGLVHFLWHDDYYLVSSDFADYYRTQRRIDEVYKDQRRWTQMALLNTARVGYFSSDRTIKGYMQDIWHIDAMLD